MSLGEFVEGVAILSESLPISMLLISCGFACATPEPDFRGGFNPMCVPASDVFACLLLAVTIMVNAAIATYTEYSAGSALDALSKLSTPEATVIRDGSVQEVSLVGCCVVGLGCY